MSDIDDTRRRFMAAFAGAGLGATLVPDVLWAHVQQQETATPRITAAMLRDALAVAGLEFPDEDRNAMVQTVNRNLANYEDLRRLHIPNDISPPYPFSALVPGMRVNRRRDVR